VGRPWVSIDLEKLEHNTSSVVRLCAEHGIDVTGVTKGTCGSPEVAQAMLRGGCASIGESRLENVRRLRAARVETSYMMLRIPPLSRVEEVVAAVDVSLNSELTVLEGLSQAAQRLGKRHDVIVMVDLGDLREGVWPDELETFVRQVLELPGIRLVGLGSNLTCYGGVIPTEHNMGRLARQTDRIEERFGIRLACISGGNSSALPLIAAGRMPGRINHVRIGEAILLGRETIHREPWPDTFQDAFLLHAEVIERKQKPSIPIGERGEDAFGKRAVFVERGEVQRALVNVGREDVDVDGLAPLDSHLSVLGASSDYLIVDVGGARREIRVGDEISFALSYAALLAAMDSEYVEKRFVHGPESG
jgi:predicted amino acid racemase